MYEEVRCIIYKFVLDRLSYDANIIDDVCTLIKIHNKKIKKIIDEVKLVVDRVGKMNFERMLKILTSYISVHANNYAQIVIPKLDKLKEIYIR